MRLIFLFLPEPKLALHKKWSSSVNVTISQFPVDLVKFIKEILNEKIPFLCCAESAHVPKYVSVEKFLEFVLTHFRLMLCFHTLWKHDTAWKVSVLGVILFRIFSHSNWMQTRIIPNTDTFYAVWENFCKRISERILER